MRACWLLVAAIAAADESFFLRPPPNKTGPAVALVLIQGASCPPSGYRPVAEAIQEALPLPAWVAVPQFLVDTPEPVLFAAKLRNALKEMERAGMVANRTVVFGHSLGGVFSQRHVVENAKRSSSATAERMARRSSIPSCRGDASACDGESRKGPPCWSSSRFQ